MILCLVILFIVFALPYSSYAQDVAVGQATATVLATLTVTSTQSLILGNVYQGVPTSIANNNANAAIFTISGAASSGISLFISLPDYLALANGSDRMTISFSSTDASVDSLGAGNPATMAGGAGWQNTNPHSLPSATVIGSGGTTSLYLGGKALPAVDQSAGSYSADIILTVAYNGT